MIGDTILARAVAHLPSCQPPAAVDVTHHKRAVDGAAVRVARCRSCGADLLDAEPVAALEPGSPEWLDAWDSDPWRIGTALSVADRSDPKLNPLHPAAIDPPAVLAKRRHIGRR